MSETSRRVARNASYSLAGNAVAFVAGTAGSIVLARLLGPRGLGTYALVLSSTGIMGMLVRLSIPHATTKYVAEYAARGERDTVARILGTLARLEVGMALLVAGPAILLASWLEGVFQAPGFAWAFRIAAVGLLPGAVGGVATAALAGFQDFRRQTQISVARTIVVFVTTVGLVVGGTGVVGAVGAFVVGGVFAGVVSWRMVLNHHVHVSFRKTPLPTAARAKLRRYAPAVGAVLFLDAVVWQRSEVFFLGIFRTPQEVAWYAVAFGVATTVTRLFPRALTTVLAPVASGLYGAADRPGMRTLFRVGSRYLTMLVAPFVVGGAVLARPLLTTVYGPEYAPAAAVFPLLLLGAGFGAVGSVTAGIQKGIERQDLVLKVALAATLLNVGLDVSLIPLWGVVGAAIASTAAQAGAVIAGIVLTVPLVSVRFPLGSCLRIAAGAGVMGAVAFVVVRIADGPGGLVAALLSGAIVYPGALLATGAVDHEDIARLEAAGDLLPRLLRPGYGGLLRVAGKWAT